MTVYVHQVNTVIDLLLQQECTKVGEVSIVKMMLTTAICFGVMANVDTAVYKMEYIKWDVKHEKFKLTYDTKRKVSSMVKNRTI